MGAIFDRSREFLGTTDKAIITFRRIMVTAAKKFRDTGELPATIDNPELYRVRGFAALLPKDQNWIEASEDWRKAFSDGPPEEYRVRVGGGGMVQTVATPPALSSSGE